MATLEEAIRVIRALVEGETIAYEGTELHFPWTTGWDLPVWVAGYGPMALAMTGRVADGVILQLADPDLIRWFVGQVREAEAAAGRPAGSVRVQAAAPAHVGDLRDVSRADALVPGAGQQPRRRPRQQVPARAAARVADRLHPRPRGLRLPPPRRGRVVERRASSATRSTDRFCVLGSVDEHIAKLRRAGRRRRRPVQHLPDERRRGGGPRGLRPRDHPGDAGLGPRPAPAIAGRCAGSHRRPRAVVRSGAVGGGSLAGSGDWRRGARRARSTEPHITPPEDRPVTRLSLAPTATIRTGTSTEPGPSAPDEAAPRPRRGLGRRSCWRSRSWRPACRRSTRSSSSAARAGRSWRRRCSASSARRPSSPWPASAPRARPRRGRSAHRPASRSATRRSVSRSHRDRCRRRACAVGCGAGRVDSPPVILDNGTPAGLTLPVRAQRHRRDLSCDRSSRAAPLAAATRTVAASPRRHRPRRGRDRPRRPARSVGVGTAVAGDDASTSTSGRAPTSPGRTAT